MTGNNTTPGEKLRAVFLAALMVMSVFAVSVAFTGSAAAGNSSPASNLAVSPNSGASGSTVTVTVDTSTTGKDVVFALDADQDGQIESGEVLDTIQDGGTNDDDDSDNQVEGQLTIPSGLPDGSTYNIVAIEEDGTYGSGSTENGQDDTTKPFSVSGSDTVATFSVDDGEGPELDSAETVDTSYNNGEVDRVRVFFDEAVDSSTADASDFTVRLNGNQIDVATVNDNPNANNGVYVELDTTDSDLPNFNTAITPNVEVDQGSIDDPAGNSGPNSDSVVTATDGATAIYDTAYTVDPSFATGSTFDGAVLRFSEGVETNNGEDISLSEVGYVDNNGGGVSAIDSIEHAAGSNVAVVKFDTDVTSGDLGSDELYTIDSDLDDGNGNGLVQADGTLSGGLATIDANSGFDPTVYDDTATNVGDNIHVITPSDTINSDADIVAQHVYNGAETQLADLGDDGNSATAPTWEAPIPAAKDDGINQDDTQINYWVEGVNIGTFDYTTDNYVVQLDNDTVIHGRTKTIYGSIYEYWDGDSGNLEDDVTVDYSLQYDDNLASNDGVGAANTQVLADSDTGNGEFQVRRTFNVVDMDADGLANFSHDYPTDAAEYGVDAQPSYIVYVHEDSGSTPADDYNNGFAQLDTRLLVEGETEVNGTIVDQPSYRDTVDVVNGMVENWDSGLGNYALRVDDPGGVTRKTTQAAQDGSFGFTLEMNDAGDWNLGTDEGGFIGYQTITVGPQEPLFEFNTQSGEQIPSFSTTYEIALNDSKTDDPLDLDKAGVTDYDGYINVTGEFDSSSVSVGGDIIAVGPTNADGNVDYFHVSTDANGEASFTVTPLSDEVNAHLENDEADGADGVENNNDAADTPDSPDYSATRTIESAGTDPVNFVSKNIYDDNYGLDILQDSGPSVIEVLPVTETRPASGFDATNSDRDERLASDGESGPNTLPISNSDYPVYRVGWDGRQSLDEMSNYYVEFNLVDDDNDPILPQSGQGNLTNFTVSGLESSATISSNDDGSVSLSADNGIVLGASHMGSGRYQVHIRPQEAVNEDPTFDVTANVEGESPKTWSVEATGLNISEFQIDGETVTEVQGKTTPNLTAVLNAPYENGVPVNNGRVRLSRTYAGQNDPLEETDARTGNVNDGQYNFSNVDVGPRGVDLNNDGIGEELADLTFTGYQYVDANDDQALTRDEVDRAALENLNIAPRPMNIIFDPENTSVYSGHRTNDFGQPAFTMTKGMEYEQIAFHLEYSNGTAVDLTEGMGNMTVGLNELAEAGLISLNGPDSEGIPADAAVLFDEDASNASAGYYVIDDIESTYWTDSDASTEIGWATDLNEGGVFAFDDPNEADNPERAMDTYRLNIERADRSYASFANDSTGYIDVAEPKVETEILAASDADDSDIDHTPGEDAFQTVTDVDNVTAEIDRWYRVNATLTDYFGTPINGTEYSETTVDEAFSWSGVDGDGNVYNFDADDAEVVFHDTLGNNIGGGDANGAAGELALNNENGTFQFDVKPTEADADAADFQFDMQYNVSIQKAPDNLWADGTGTGAPNAVFEDSPVGTRPLVEVYDQSGAKLPISENGNKILANDVTQTIRIEAFPADENDLVLPEQTFRVNTTSDPVNENTINTLTELQNASVLVTDNEDYLNIPYEAGQVGYLTVTPTGTGQEVITLRDDDFNAVQNVSGETIVFDVLRSNKQANLELSTESVTPGSSVTVTVTAQATGEPISLAGVTLSDTNGNAISDVTTNESGMATISVPSSAQLGEYSLETRPAGYQPIVQSFQVSSPAQLDTDLELLAQEGQAISGTTSAEAGTTYTIEIEGPGLLESADAEVQDDGTFSAEFNLSSLSAGDEVTATIAGVDSVTYTVQSPPTATITMNPQVSQNGDIVTVREVFLPEGGYVVIHNASTGDVIGHTAYFDAGTYEDVDVLLDQNLAGGQNQVIAMAHLDTDGDQQYAFPDADGPYTANGEPVTDSAQVSVSSPPTTPTTTTPPPTTSTTPDTTSTTTSGDDDGDTGDGDGPGFGIALALVGLLGAALLAVRRNA